MHEDTVGIKQRTRWIYPFCVAVMVASCFMPGIARAEFDFNRYRPGGLTGDVTVDAFESHRTTNVGALIVADANGSGTVTAGDATRILNEVSLGGTLSTGQPDCNENGNITSGDATCVLNIIAL